MQTNFHLIARTAKVVSRATAAALLGEQILAATLQLRESINPVRERSNLIWSFRSVQLGAFIFLVLKKIGFSIFPCAAAIDKEFELLIGDGR